MKNRLIAAIIAVALVLVTLISVLIVREVRKSPPPELSTLRDRVIALVDASAEVNEILFGQGLPTYPRINRPVEQPFYLNKTENGFVFSAESTAHRLYYRSIPDEKLGTVIAYQYCLRETVGEEDYLYIDVEMNIPRTSWDLGKLRYVQKTTEVREEEPIYVSGNQYYYRLEDYVEDTFYYDDYQGAQYAYYDFVKPNEEYSSIADIKKKAETVYAKSYLESVYDSLFVGISISEEENGTLYARYMEGKDKDGIPMLLKLNTYEGLDTGRVYLYDTMRYSEEKRSSANYVYIEMDTHLEGEEDKLLTVRISLTLVNGMWYLDSPTY
ncbi:MAG: hypothetical protein E7644_00655 [Ruminococcaceae bacterium]|nr:hypothetical protein [Oscillospiraceae bacterium]